MIDTKTLIAMIEWRQKQRPFFMRVTQREPSPSNVSMFQLWQTPEYLIYLAEKEVASLRSVGMSESQATERLGSMFRLDRPAGDLDGLVRNLLAKYFPDYLANNTAHLPKMRRLAGEAVQEGAGGSYPPKDWLGHELSASDFRERMGKSLQSLSVFPRSEFDAQLVHFMVMMEAGGRIFEFASPAETWRHMMGRGGLALVKDGRSLAYIETMMN